MDDLMKMNLQFFAEEGTAEGATAEQTQQDETEVGNKSNKPTPKYTDEDVDSLFNKKFASHKVEIEELKAELESVKTKGMSEEEEKSYTQQREEKKLSERIKNLEQKEKDLSLKEETMTAKSLLADKDIDRKYVHFLVDAGEFKSSEEKLEAFIDVYTEDFNAKVEAGVKKALSGTAPKVHTNKANTMTKEEFTALSYPEKLEFKRTNEEQYKQLSAY